MSGPAPESRDLAASEHEASVVRSAVRAIRSSDRHAFARLVELYQRRLFGLTLMMVRDPSAAEEITQDAFVRAFTRLGQYDARRPFYPWLATIAVRLAQTWLRGRQRIAEREGAALDAETSTRNTSADPLETLITDERDRKLWRLVEALASGERTAVILYYRQEMKVGEIAHALGVTSGTVKTLLFRARRRLRQAMEQEQEQGRSSGRYL